MNATAKLFEEELSKVPDDVKIEHDITFAIADKIDAALKEKKHFYEGACPKDGKDRGRSVKMAWRNTQLYRPHHCKDISSIRNIAYQCLIKPNRIVIDKTYEI